MITFGLGRDTDVIGSYVAFGLGIKTLAAQIIVDVVVNVIIEEELRILKISKDSRIDIAELDIRAFKIKKYGRVLFVEN